MPVSYYQSILIFISLYFIEACVSQHRHEKIKINSMLLEIDIGNNNESINDAIRWRYRNRTYITYQNFE